MYAELYIATGEYDKAEACCNAMDSLTASPRASWNESRRRVKIYESRKQYEQALDIIDKAFDSKPGEALDVSNMMWKKACILAQLKRTDEALEWFENAVALRDSVRNFELNRQLDELHSLYEIDKITAEKEAVQNYLLFALGGCVFLAFLLGIWIHYSRLVMRKNRTMVEQIHELQEQEQQERQTDKIFRKITSEPAAAADSNLYLQSRRDKLCLAIYDLLFKEKVYQETDISRDAIVSRLGTNRTLFMEAFLSSYGASFLEYINDLRLKDAILLLEQSDLSMEEISEKVGFGTVKTFRRQFQAKYNMLPKIYRNLTKNFPKHVIEEENED
jgi:AraC-like DNA-binding protein